MDPRIVVCEEEERGCGYRKKGGIYLRLDEPLGQPCGRLPLEMTTRPCCGEGIRPARGWTWIDPARLVAKLPPCPATDPFIRCGTCPMGGTVDKAGLVWIGESFYPTPQAWLAEVTRMGVSRRVTALPRGFDLGTTWVLVGHRRVEFGAEQRPGIFHAFLPNRIEQVIDETSTGEEIDAIEKRGFVPVLVKRIGEQIELPGS